MVYYQNVDGCQSCKFTFINLVVFLRYEMHICKMFQKHISQQNFEIVVNPNINLRGLEVNRKLREGKLQGTFRKCAQASGENQKKPKTKQNKGVLVSNDTFIDLNLVNYYFFATNEGVEGCKYINLPPPRVISPLNLKFIQSNTKRSEKNTACCSFHVHCCCMHKINPNNLVIYIT